MPENSLSATDTFVSFLLSIQNVEPITVLSVLMLTWARLVPIVALAPFLGAKNISRTVRVMFGLSLAMLFLPYNLLVIHTNILFDDRFIGLMLKEVCIGAFLGFIAAAPFFIAQTTGSLIDHSRGSSALQVTDPTTQSQTGPVGLLYNFVLIALFYSLNGPFLFFNAIASSYQLLPIDGIISAAFFTARVSFWQEIMALGQKIMNLAIQIAAPALIGMLLTDLFLGIANRLAPQVQVVFLGIPLKSWVGIALMTAAWTLTLQVLGKESLTWIKAINQTIYQASQANA